VPDRTTSNVIRQTNRRRRWALLPHYGLTPLGWFEVTDLYWIDPRTELTPRGLEAYSIVRADDRDIDFICNVITRDQPAHTVRTRWRNGHHCFVAKFDGEVVGYDWIAFSDTQEQEYRVELQPGHAFCLDAFMVPRHRGKGVHHELLCAMLKFAADEGKTKAFTAVSLFNRNSWKSHVRMGWQRVHTIAYFRPYFTFSRLPWRLTSAAYPIELDWKRHAWDPGVANS